jgi:hypothetical protein
VNIAQKLTWGILGGFAMFAAILFSLYFYIHVVHASHWPIRSGNDSGGLRLYIYLDKKLFYTLIDPSEGVTSRYESISHPRQVSPPLYEQFFDGSSLPGRWILRYKRSEIDITEHGMVIDEKRYPPDSIVTLND